MRLAIRRTEAGARFVVEDARAEIDSGDGKSPLLAQTARETLRLGSGQEWAPKTIKVKLFSSCQNRRKRGTRPGVLKFAPFEHRGGSGRQVK